MRGACRACANEIANLVIEEGQADRVLLAKKQVGQGGGHHHAVIKLADPAGGVVHGLRGVQQDVGVEVGLLLVLLDVETIGAAEDLPVNVTDIISGDIFPVLGKLDAEAVIRTSMQTRDETLHDQPGLDLQPGYAVEDLGIEVLGRRFSSQSYSPNTAIR